MEEVVEDCAEDGEWSMSRCPFFFVVDSFIWCNYGLGVCSACLGELDHNKNAIMPAMVPSKAPSAFMPTAEFPVDEAPVAVLEAEVMLEGGLLLPVMVLLGVPVGDVLGEVGIPDVTDDKVEVSVGMEVTEDIAEDIAEDAEEDRALEVGSMLVIVPVSWAETAMAATRREPAAVNVVSFIALSRSSGGGLGCLEGLCA